MTPEEKHRQAIIECGQTEFLRIVHGINDCDEDWEVSHDSE